MTKYREILRLTALGLSLRDIEKSLKVSRKTVVKVQKRADELSLSWPLDESLTDAELEQRMFPKDLSPKSTKRMPDFDYIRKELLKNGVNKKLLWTEYLEECSQNGDDALMYSQFCYYIQQNEQKSRATMHIPRKAGQQIEVDWAGDPAKLIFFRTDCRSLLSVSVFLCFQERYSVWRNRRIEQGSMLHHLSFCCLSGKLCLRKNPHLL